MKRVIPIVIVIMLAITMNISTDAATTGINPTQYDITISNPTPIKDESITIDTHVEIWETDHWTDMYQGLGEMRHFLLSYDSSVGSVQTTDNFEYDLSTTLEYDFTLSEDKSSIYAIKIPMTINTDDTQFASGTEISVTLHQDTELLLTYALVDWEIIQHLMDNDGLMIPINTVYTIMSQHSLGLALSKDTLYTLKFDFFNFPDATTVNIPTDPGYSSQVSLVAGTIQPYTPGFVLYSGIKLGETRTASGGMHSIDLSMDYGSYFYLSTFFDEMTNWQRFMYLQEFNIADASNPHIESSDATFDWGDNINIEATVRVDLGGAILINQPVSLYERDGLIFDLVATGLTNSLGKVSFSLDHINNPGSHEFMLETYYNSKRASINVIITLNEPVGTYSGLQAMGYYSSAGIVSTIVTIEGYVIQSGSSNPVASQEFEIYREITLIQTVTTDSTGYFAFDVVFDDAVGVYTDLMSIRYTGSVWGITDSSFDLQILKGMPSIDIVDVQLSYTDQPFSFIGFVTDMSISPIQVDATLEYYDSINDMWIADGTVTVLANGSLSGSSSGIRDAGQYVYQVRTVENSNFRSVSKAFNVLIDSTQMTITRGGLPDPYYVEYHENGDYSVVLLDTDSNPIVGVSVRFSTNDVAEGTMIDLSTVTTDENGKASLSWIIPDDNLALIYSPLDMIISYIGSDNYQTYDFVLEYYLIPTTLTAAIDPGLTEFNSISTISIDMDDIAGFDVKEGIDFVVDIDGNVYNLQTDASGELVFTHEYDIVGLSTFTISYDRDAQLTENGYESFSHTEQINIDKGTFNIVMEDLIVSQGSYYDLDIYVEDVNLDPVEGVAVEVLLYNNIEWVTVLTGSTSPIGVVSTNLLASLAPGIYSYKVVIAEGNQYFGATETKLFVVADITTMIREISVPSSYFYGSDDVDRYVELQLVVDNLNQPLSGLELITNFGTLSFSNTTDVNGRISFHLPQYETPGSISLSVSFAESGVYKASQFNTDILVDGIDTLINWIQLPSDTYYGEILSTSVIVTDNMGNPLVNYEVVLTINDLSYSRFSDINGEVFFSIELRTDLGISTVFVELQGTLGFDPASISLDISHDKRSLELDIDTSSGLNEAQYAYPTEFVGNPFVMIDSIPYQLTDCIIEVYWADVFGGEWILIDTISYDGNPFSVVLPQQDVGVTQFLKFVAIDSDYHPGETVFDVVITPGVLIIDLSYDSNVNFGTIIDMQIQYTDYLGNLLSMTVELMYVDPITSEIIYVYDPITLVNGMSTFGPTAFAYGELVFNYIITDPSGNYQIAARQISVSVNLKSMSWFVSLDTIAGQGYVVVDQALPVMTDLNGSMLIYKWDVTDWVLIGSAEITMGSGAFLLSEINIGIDLRIKIESLGYVDMVYILPVEEQYIDLLLGEQTVQTQVWTSLNFTVNSLSSVDGYTVIVLYYDGSSWIELGTLILDADASTSDLIYLDLDPGYYDIALHVPAQVFLFDSSFYTTVHVIKKNINLVFDQLDVYSNISTTVLINTLDDNSDSVDDILIILYLDDEIITSATSVDGIAQLEFTLDIPLGEYAGRFLILGDAKTRGYELSIIIYVWREANIGIEVLEEIVYTDGGIIAVEVTDFDTGDPIADASVSLAYKHIFEWINLGSAVSNDMGIATIYVDSINPGNYLIRATMTQVDIYGSVYIEETVTVLPETIDIEFEMIDYGISHNRTITFELSDESESIDEGNIHYKIMTADDQVFDQGSFDIRDSNELTIPGDLIGNYYLSVTYGHNTNYYVYNSQLIIPDIGYDQLYARDIQIDYKRVDFTDTELSIQFCANGSSLSGLSVLIYTNHTGYINLVTDNNGYIHVPINYTLPGEYSIRIEIMSNIYISDDFGTDYQLTINRADIGFEVEVPETVYYSDGITVHIVDEYHNSSSYEIRIITLDGQHLQTSDRFNSSSYHYIFDLTPGEYVFAIIRYNDLLLDEPVKHNVIIEAKPVEIDIDHTVNPDNDTVDIVISGLFDDISIDGVTYNLTIYSGGVFYFQINSTLTINVYGTGSLTIYANAMHPFSGEMNLIIDYDVTTVEISDTTGGVDTTDDPDNGGNTIFGEVLATLLTIGAGAQGIPVLRKKFGK